MNVQEQLKAIQSKYNMRYGIHRVDYKFQLGDTIWLYFNKERL